MVDLLHIMVEFVEKNAGGEELSVGWRRAIMKTQMSINKNLKMWRELDADTGAEWTWRSR